MGSHFSLPFWHSHLQPPAPVIYSPLPTPVAALPVSPSPGSASPPPPSSSSPTSVPTVNMVDVLSAISATADELVPALGADNKELPPVFICSLSDHTLVLDIMGASKAENAQAILWKSNNGDNEKMQIMVQKGNEHGPVINSIIFFKFLHSGLFLGVIPNSDRVGQVKAPQPFMVKGKNVVVLSSGYALDGHRVGDAFFATKNVDSIYQQFGLLPSTSTNVLNQMSALHLSPVGSLAVHLGSILIIGGIGYYLGRRSVKHV